MNRRNLIDGLKETPEVVAELERQFVRGKQPSAATPTTKPPSAVSVARTPVSTRLRPDLAEALKRASLQRQLDKVEPNTLTDILEAAVEPWLKDHGYLT